jgi:hypothetical protein
MKGGENNLQTLCQASDSNMSTPVNPIVLGGCDFRRFVIIGECPQSRNQELVITQAKRSSVTPSSRPPSLPPERSERLNLGETETGVRENLTVKLGFPTTVGRVGGRKREERWWDYSSKISNLDEYFPFFFIKKFKIIFPIFLDSNWLFFKK